MTSDEALMFCGVLAVAWVAIRLWSVAKAFVR